MDINFEKSTLSRHAKSLSKMAQSTRRLNSGYRINSAADDAAGLAVSEKLRAMDRGLRQGLRNISDGMNFLATQDGAEQVINNSLHRLKEIAVEAANGTCTRLDRESLDLEYQQILDEIGDITSVGDFNGVPLFDQHLPEYSTFAGEIEHADFIDIIAGKNSPLVVNYTENGANKTVSLSIPTGRWTADEIADIIDDKLYETESPLIIGVNSLGQFSLQCEGGKVNYISGPGRSLFYNQKDGVKSGYLIGVTAFGSETMEVRVLQGHNDEIKFRLEGDPSDRVYTVHLLKDGETGDYDDGAKGFNYNQLIERFNEGLAEALDGTEFAGTVTAIRTTNSDGENVIGLSSDLPVTGLAGNFIMLEQPQDKYNSVLYDISSYSSVDNTNSTIDGKHVLESKINIYRDRNDYFYVNFKYYTGEKEQGERLVRFDLLGPVDSKVHEKDYSPLELVDKINSIIADNFEDLPFVPAVAELNKDGTIHFETTQYGNLCNVDLIEGSAPSGYMLTDLFDIGTLNTPAVTEDSVYTPASCTGLKNIGGSVTLDDTHNELQYTITVIDPNDESKENKPQHTYTLDFKLDAGTYSTNDLVQRLNDQLKSKIDDIKNSLGGVDRKDLKVDMEFTISGGGLSLRANGEAGTAVTYINANGSTAYRRLIQGVTYVGGPSVTAGNSIKYKTEEPGSSIDYSNGTPAGEAYYTSGNNSSTKSKEGDVYTFEYDMPKAERGGPDTLVDWITDEKGTPATLAYNSAGTQFDKDGKAIRDITVKFTLFDGVNTFEYNETVNAGATKQDLEDAISAASAAMGNPNGKVKVDFSGSQLLITSEAKGNNMRFTQYDSGNIAEKAINHAPAGATIIDNKTYTTAPSLTLGDAGTNLPLTLNGSNNTISFNVGGTSVNVNLGNNNEKIYMSDLVSKINAAFKEPPLEGKATASASGNSLIIKGGEGITGEISYTSSGTVPLDKRLNPATTVAQPGRAILPDADTQIPLKIIDGSCDTLSFDYTIAKDDGTTETKHVELDLSDGFDGKVYNSIGTLASDLNSLLPPEDQGNVVFSRDPNTGGLMISTVGKGAGYKISNVGGNMKLDKRVTTADTQGTTPDLDTNQVKLPAKVSNGSFYSLFSVPSNDPGLEIIKGVNDTVSVTVGGENVTIKLDPDTYTNAASIVTQLRTHTDPNTGKRLTDLVDISDSGGLTFTSKEGGTGVTIDISGTNADIFKAPRADFNPDYQRRIAILCHINGTAQNNNIVIHDWDNEMTFKYKSTDTEHEVKVSIPSGTYTNAELAEALQTAIDNKLGKDDLRQLKVEAKSDGTISIVGATITANRSIWDFKGRLYDRILQSDVLNVTGVHKETAARSKGEVISYILGRNPMEPVTEEEIDANTNIIIYPNLNDNFTFDLKYDVKAIDENGFEYTEKRTAEISLTLPAGEYDRKKIASTIQELTREQIPYVASGLDPEKFRATISLAPIGIEEPEGVRMPSEDRLVLSYSTPQDGSVDDCDVTIEGIRGNIAYRAFYQASDTPRPTTIVGAADIKNGVTINPGVNDRFTVGFEGEFVTVNLRPGYYTAEELLNYLNSCYENMDAPIRASMKGDNLMLYSSENGAFNIDPIAGNAAYTLFYGGEKRDDDDSYIGIHSGRRTNSYIWYEKTRLDQHLMRINTTGVTTIDRALKAISRLDNAHSYLLRCRAMNGANENRSARTYDRNVNVIENIENSESSIRDTDIATEVSNVRKQMIIQQIQENLQSQNRQTVSDMVLNQLNQKG